MTAKCADVPTTPAPRSRTVYPYLSPLCYFTVCKILCSISD